MRILVTGLSGFTGQYLRMGLESNGHHVIGLQADLTSLGDTTSDVKKARPDAVIHLAGIAFVGHGNADSFYNVNIIGTRNLLLAIEHTSPNIKTVLLASSANVYGDKTEGQLTESATLNPINDYAVSKLSMEHMSHLWSNRLPIIITRPFNYTGLGQSERFLIPKIISHFKRKANVIELGNIDISRDFGDVRSVSAAYKGLIESPPIGQTLNICTGRAYSLKHIVELCQNITAHTIDIQINPQFIRENEVRTLTGDPTLLRKTLPNWNAIPFTETLQWMLT